MAKSIIAMIFIMIFFGWYYNLTNYELTACIFCGYVFIALGEIARAVINIANDVAIIKYTLILNPIKKEGIEC